MKTIISKRLAESRLKHKKKRLAERKLADKMGGLLSGAWDNRKKRIQNMINKKHKVGGSEKGKNESKKSA